MLRLLSRTGTQTADGRCLPQETARQVFCSVESVSRAEWAAAGQLGLAPQWRVTLFAPDYNGEDAAELDDADAHESEAPAVEPEFESGDAPDDDAANDEDANDDSPADVEAAADADPSSDNAPVIGDDLEDDGPAQGAHFGKPRDNR